jgi:hypothetical protein
MASGLQLFATFILVQFFYAAIVTFIIPTVPGVVENQIMTITSNGSIMSVAALSTQLQSGVTGQTGIPLLDFGALIFYTSNIILSLMLNFFTAIPQMLTILLTFGLMLIPIDPTLTGNIKVYFMAIVSIIYFIAIFTFIMGARSGRPLG